MEKVSDKFLRYVSFETTSDAYSKETPSSKLQLVLAAQLQKELEDLGLKTKLSEDGIVYAKLASNNPKVQTKLGFIAHMDTSPDASGKDVQARIIKNYDGKDILLNKEKEIWMLVEDFPYLANKKGEDLIVTDGTTLLGADDKAGIAAIMSALEFLVKHPEIKHGEIKVAFTPDEEIGRGTENFDVAFFDCDFAYTIDGSAVDCIEYENFNAASAKVLVKGRNIHPGAAKNKMLNSILIAQEFISLFPANQTPANTKGYEGFYHLHGIKGDIEESTLKYLIRNHDRKLFEEQKTYMEQVASFLNKKYAGDWVKVEIKDSYRNMKEVFKDKMYIIDLAKNALANLGLEAKFVPIRGGTDGANLSFMGLPCPNLGAGGYNFHSRFEYLSINELEKSVKLILEIIKLVK